MSTNKKFTGMALISFENENMKNRALKENRYSHKERIMSFFNDGKTPNLTDYDLSWHGQKLFID